MATTARQSNAHGRSKAPSRFWGGAAPSSVTQVALHESEEQNYADTYGITKDVALAWVKKKNTRNIAVYKISKQFCSGVKPVFKRELNPLFITMQIAALTAQGVVCSYEALVKDMLELHDPACVTAVHAFKCQRDLELQQPQHPTLEAIHDTCVACYTKWFQEEHANYPEEDLLITVARTEQATRSVSWQFADTSSNRSASDVADGILQVSSLQRLSDPSAEWLSAVAVSEGCSVPDLMTQLQQTAATSTFLQSLLVSSHHDHLEDISSMLQHSTPVAALPPHCWRLLAITLQRNIFIVDSEHSRMRCYPCHNGKVDVHGAGDYGGEPNAWSIKSWDQSGFFFALDKLPLPTCLSEPGCVVYVMPDNASVQATAKLDVQDEDAEKAAATALQSLGLCCAEIQFEISDRAGQPKAKSENLLPCVEAGRKECLGLLTKIAGDAAVSLTFRFNHMSPGTGHVPIQLTTDMDGTKLSMKEIATLAWMWNRQFFADSSKPQVFSLIYCSLTPVASAPQASEYEANLVEKASEEVC